VKWTAASFLFLPLLFSPVAVPLPFFSYARRRKAFLPPFLFSGLSRTRAVASSAWPITGAKASSPFFLVFSQPQGSTMWTVFSSELRVTFSFTPSGRSLFHGQKRRYTKFFFVEEHTFPLGGSHSSKDASHFSQKEKLPSFFSPFRPAEVNFFPPPRRGRFFFCLEFAKPALPPGSRWNPRPFPKEVVVLLST